MATGKSQFIGAAGQFYVAYKLSQHNINASITIGNAPSVDIIASSDDGRYSLSFQVKTSRNAYRNKKWHCGPGYEWSVGASVIGKYKESFWYALIDLQENNGIWNPKVFFVPSEWVAKFVKPEFSMHNYYLSSKTNNLEAIEKKTLERWDLVKAYLKGDQMAIDWANNWPENELARWGTEE